MTHNGNLSTGGMQAPAEQRLARELEAMRRLRAYKRATGLSCEGLAAQFGVSVDSVERYLSGRRAVPGQIVVALDERIAA